MNQPLRWILILFICGSFLYSWQTLPREEYHDYAGHSDEYFYLSYAKQISQTGLSGFKDLTTWYSQSEKNRYHPSPLRAGYILLTVLFINLFGQTFSALVILSFVCFALSCLIFYHYTKRNFSEPIALFFIFLLSASPLALGMSHVALSESLIYLLMGASAWLFLDFLQRPTRKTLAILTSVLFLSLLVKETTCLFILFILIFSWIAKKKFSIKIAKKDLLILTTAPPLLTVIFYLFLLGWDNFALALHSIYLTHFVDQTNRYALQFSSGPWYRYLVDFMIISPVMTTIAIGYSFHLIVKEKPDWKAIYFLIYSLVTFIPLSMLKHSKVIRFVVNLEMVIALFCTFAIIELCKEDLKQQKNLKIAFILLTIFVFSYQQFLTIFLSPFLLDPISYNILWIKNFIPQAEKFYF